MANNPVPDGDDTPKSLSPVDMLACNQGRPRSFTKDAVGVASLDPFSTDETPAADAAQQRARYSFVDKVQPGDASWPVLFGFAANLNQQQTTPDADIFVEIGFTPSQQYPQTPFATAKALPRWVIFRGNMNAADDETNTVVDTNFGRGWVVPAFEAMPMDFYVTCLKDEQVVSFVCNGLWGYTVAGQL